jgi:GWxTD domain-containing protein
MFGRVRSKSGGTQTRLASLILCATSLSAALPPWLDLVAPILTPGEKKLYLSLEPEARARFEQDFWTGKGIGAEEYFSRVQYIDANFGSNRRGSGANTDQGRVYLSIGPPTRVNRIPSSRIFVPLEIWYYDTVPGIHLTTELRLIFYQPRSIGFSKLYSPTLDTIRALLLPQASTVGMFGPNDDITEASIRTNLTVSSAEDEVISAAVNVASGVKYSGNDQILGQITSPMLMLGKQPQADVQSRFIVGRPKLDVLTAVSPYSGTNGAARGAKQVDLELEVSAQRELDLQVLDGPIAVYQNRLHLKFSGLEPLRYTHRLDLLPGHYRLLFTVDDTVYAYTVEVPEHAALSPIFRADESASVSGRRTPFEFDGRHLEPNPAGMLAVVTVPRPGRVTWVIRSGAQAIWKSVTEGAQAAIVELPSRGLRSGAYRLEAVTDDDFQSMELTIGSGPPSVITGTPVLAGTLVSFNANLAPSSRLVLLGHQWLLRDHLPEARQCIEASLSQASTHEAQIELARLDALNGRLDAGRDRVRAVLNSEPNNFEALSVLAYIEARFRDYPAAADLYRRALAVEESPALRLALAKLPQ